MSEEKTGMTTVKIYGANPSGINTAVPIINLEDGQTITDGLITLSSNFMFNGSTYDRQRNNEVKTTDDSALPSLVVNGIRDLAIVENFNGNSIIFDLRLSQIVDTQCYFSILLRKIVPFGAGTYFNILRGCIGVSQPILLDNFLIGALNLNTYTFSFGNQKEENPYSIGTTHFVPATLPRNFRISIFNHPRYFDVGTFTPSLTDNNPIAFDAHESMVY